MSTLEQQGVGADHHEPQDMDAAVEAQMGKIMAELGGALGVLLTSLGTRSGLWAALAGAGPLTTEEVAAKVLVDPALVREWLRAQAAGDISITSRAEGRSSSRTRSPPRSTTDRVGHWSMRQPR